MSTDALTYKHIASELNAILTGGRIDKITMPAFDTVILTIYANRKNHSLLISADPSRARCYLTTKTYQNPLTAPSFLMHLRKHIQGGKIDKIETLKNERILNIHLTSKSELYLTEHKTLTAELMGKHSNIILINEDNTISDCVRKNSFDLSTKRVLLSGMVYPAVESKAVVDTFTETTITRFLEAFEGGNLTNYIQNGLRCLSKDSINHVLFKTFSSLNPSDFSFNKFSTLAKNILAFLSEKSINPCVCFADDTPKDFYILPYSFLDKNDLKFFDSLNAAADYFYGILQDSKNKNQSLNSLNSAINAKLKKEEKKLARVLEQELFASGFKQDKLFGELITSNIYAIKKGACEFEAINYYEQSPNNRVKIPLQTNLSPQANAQKYYKLYNKKKRTLQSCSEQKQKIEKEISYLISIRESINLFNEADELNEIKLELIQNGILKNKTKPQKAKNEKQPQLKFLRYEVDDYLITVGKNNLQNEQLFKSAKPYDLWLHVKDEHGSHVVISNKTKDFPPDNVLLTAASYAALHSKAKNADKTAVDYTFSKNVSKPPASPLGYVTYTNQYTVYVTPKKP